MLGHRRIFRQLLKAGPGSTGDEIENFADREYASYQGHLANILMMGTLFFGFCVTGSFLSVTFTGEEPYTDNRYLIGFVQHGFSSSILALVATIVTFIFSTRSASLYISAGAVAAVRSLYRTVFFIGVAEILLYVSLWQFMWSLKDYASMNYFGPNICVTSTKYALADDWVNSSFCSQTGANLFSAALRLCGEPRDFTTSGEASTGDCKASDRPMSDRLYVTCSVYDCYHAHHARDATWWFGWDELPKEYSQFEHISVWEAFLRVIKESAAEACGVGTANSNSEVLCDFGSQPAPEARLACATAQATGIAASNCASSLAQDAMKCRKVCQSVQKGSRNGSKPLREVLGNKLYLSFAIIEVFLLLVMVLRGIANCLLTYACCQKLSLLSSQTNETETFLDKVDLCGILDHNDKSLEEDSEDESVTSRGGLQLNASVPTAPLVCGPARDASPRVSSRELVRGSIV